MTTAQLLAAVRGTPNEATIRGIVERPAPVKATRVKRAPCPLAARTSPAVLAKDVTLHIQTRSLNHREHWSERSRRCKAQRRSTYVALLASVPLPELPVTVTLVRVGLRPLDHHDNLCGSCKPVVDGIADAFGVRDDDARIEWVYGEQEKGGYCVKVKIQHREASNA